MMPTLPDRAIDDRCWKVLHLPVDFPFRFVVWEMLQAGMCIPMHKFSTDACPDGVKIDGIFYAPDYAAWAYVLYHPSWPSVPLGDMIPRINDSDVRMEVFVLGDDPSKMIQSLGKVQSWRDLPSLLGG